MRRRVVSDCVQITSTTPSRSTSLRRSHDRAGSTTRTGLSCRSTVRGKAARSTATSGLLRPVAAVFRRRAVRAVERRRTRSCVPQGVSVKCPEDKIVARPPPNRATTRSSSSRHHPRRSRAGGHDDARRHLVPEPGAGPAEPIVGFTVGAISPSATRPRRRDRTSHLLLRLAHYHELGRRLTLEAVRADGTAATLHDRHARRAVLGGPSDPLFADRLHQARFAAFSPAPEVVAGASASDIAVPGVPPTRRTRGGGVNAPRAPPERRFSQRLHYSTPCEVATDARR